MRGKKGSIEILREKYGGPGVSDEEVMRRMMENIQNSNERQRMEECKDFIRQIPLSELKKPSIQRVLQEHAKFGTLGVKPRKEVPKP